MNTALETWKRTGIVPYHTENYTPFHVDYEYLRWVQPLLDQPLKKGRVTDDYEFFGTVQMEFDLTKGFPLMTTKRMPMKTIAIELIWMLSGDTNIKYLNERKVKIWDEWADVNGNLGPIYGYQWRSYPTPNRTKKHQTTPPHPRNDGRPPHGTAPLAGTKSAPPRIYEPPCQMAWYWHR